MLTDLDLGMNEHICDDLTWDEGRRYDRGKVLSAQDLENVDTFGRYLDVDGDGITYRTVPGTSADKGAFFTRGTSRDEYAKYTEKGEDYQRNMERLEVKWATAPKHLPKPIETTSANNIGVIHFGTSLEATHEALDYFAADGHAANDLRILAFPFQEDVLTFVEKHQQIIVVEQNRDAQFKALLVNELQIDPNRLHSVLHYNGDPISARNVRAGIDAIVSTHSQSKSAASN